MDTTAMVEIEEVELKNENIGHVSPVLMRLIEEVRNEDDLQMVGNRYDRTHNRHNR